MQDLTPEPFGSSPPSLEARPLRGMFLASAQYALGGLAYKAIALVLVPILARLMQPAQVGLLDFAVVVALVVSVLGTVGLETSLARLDAESPDPDVWASAGMVLLLGLVTVGFLGILASGLLAASLLGSTQHGAVIASGVIYGTILGASTMALNVVRLRGQPRLYATYGFFIVTGEALAALALAALGAPVPVIILGWALAAAIGTIVLVMREHPPFGRPSLPTMMRLTAFGLPLVPAALAWILSELFIRSVVSRELGLDSMGLYGIALRIGSVLTLIVSGFALAWHPFLYRSGAVDVRSLADQASVTLSGGLGAFAILLASTAPEAVAVVAGPGYAGAANVVPALTLGATLFGMITLSSAVLGVGFDTRALAIASILGAATQVAGAIVLTPRVGLVGAGIAYALGYAFAFAIVSLTTRLPLGRVALQLTVVVVTVAVLTQQVNAPVWIRLGIGLVGIVALVASSFVSRLIRRGDTSTPG